MTKQSSILNLIQIKGFLVLEAHILDLISKTQKLQQERRGNRVLHNTKEKLGRREQFFHARCVIVTYGRPWRSHRSREAPILPYTDTGARGHTPRGALVLLVSLRLAPKVKALFLHTILHSDRGITASLQASTCLCDVTLGTR